MVVFIFFSLASCGDEQPYKVDAGEDRIVDIGSTVTLTGGVSDSAIIIAEYEWTQISGIEVELEGADAAVASFIAPDVTSDTTLVFQLTITDDTGIVSTDEVIVNIEALPPTPDQASRIEIEPNNSSSEAIALNIGETISGQVANDADQDWYAVNLIANTNYRIQFSSAISSTGASSSGDWHLKLYDTSLSLLSLL